MSSHDSGFSDFVTKLASGKWEGASPDINSFQAPLRDHAGGLFKVWATTHDSEAVRTELRRRMELSVELRSAMLGAAEQTVRTVSLANLLAMSFQPLQWAVPNLMPAGMTSLGGRPKLGKSWLGLQTAGAVGTGGELLGIRVERKRVLVYALEDSLRRIKDRAEKQRIAPDADIDFRTSLAPLTQGGQDELHRELSSGVYGLVIIDTLGRVLGNADHNDNGEMTHLLGPLQRQALDADIALLVLDHHRKSTAFEGNPIDDLIGSTGKSAVLDGALGLFRTRGKRGATLKVTGRDFDERELALGFDTETCSWMLLGEAGQVLADTVKGEILIAIRALVDLDELPTTKRIAEHIGRDPGNVSHAIQDLATAGTLVRGPKTGREQPYYLPGEHDLLIRPA